MVRKFLITMLLMLVIVPLWGASYTLAPGSLASVLREIIDAGPEKVVIEGEAFSSELQALKRLPATVTNLDLSRLTIKGDDAFGNGVLPPFALFATHIKTISLPASLTEIGEGAFAETPLESVTLPSSLRNIGPRAFYKCKALKSADMNVCDVWVVAEECFYGCAMLEELKLPTQLTEVRDRALMRTSLHSLSIPNVWKIENFALAEIPFLSEISLRKGVEVGEGAFFNTPNLPAVDEFALSYPVLGFAMTGDFFDGNLINADVIPEGAFAGCRISSIRLGLNVEKIEPFAFRNIEGLKSVDVTAKGAEIPLLSEEAFSGVDVSEVRLLVAPGYEDGWREAPGWKDFMIEALAGVEDIMPDAEAVVISGGAGMVEIRASMPIDYVGVYSPGGIRLFERRDCGETVSVGPLGDKEVVVRAVAGDIVKVAVLLIN